MNKIELVEELTNKTNITHKEASAAIDSFIRVITETLVEGGRVQLTNFGTFETKERKEREYNNPRTGGKITVPARVVPIFKASKVLKERVNND